MHGIKRKNEFKPLEIYDLEADPGEERNLASMYPERVARMTKAIDDSRTENVDFPLTYRDPNNK